MKRSGILHPGINHLLASTGHTAYFTVCDRGFPVPQEPERIDLALVDGIPTVLDVLKAVNAEFVIDRVLVAEEALTVSPEWIADLRSVLGEIPLQTVSHLELKRLSHEGRGTIRTADTALYANIIVISG
ncbi:MAG: D-ribose pyranase [Thermomicrobiales bacterium]